MKKLHELELDLMKSNIDHLMQQKIHDLDYHESLNKRAINCKNSQMVLDKTKQYIRDREMNHLKKGLRKFIKQLIQKEK